MYGDCLLSGKDIQRRKGEIILYKLPRILDLKWKIFLKRGFLDEYNAKSMCLETAALVVPEDILLNSII